MQTEQLLVGMIWQTQSILHVVQTMKNLELNEIKTFWH